MKSFGGKMRKWISKPLESTRGIMICEGGNESSQNDENPWRNQCLAIMILVSGYTLYILLMLKDFEAKCVKGPQNHWKTIRIFAIRRTGIHHAGNPYKTCREFDISGCRNARKSQRGPRSESSL